MATLITLRRRIRAAQNVSKTTKAMQMIAASKLKRAQEATLAARPYVQKLTDLTHELAVRVDNEKKHPYMRVHGENTKTLVLVLSPDKGLCGGLVTNLLREFLHYSRQNDNDTYIVVGKKIESQVVRLRNEVLASFTFGTSLPKFDIVYPIIKLIDDYFLTGQVSQVKVIYTDFNTMFSQKPKIIDLLPIRLPETAEGEVSQEQLFEPSVETMLPSLLKHYLEMSLYQYFLESFLSEQAARMMAMQNASNNARDIIEALRLEYNKTRQAKITSELLDITGTKKEEA